MQLRYFAQSPHPISIALIGCGGTGSCLLQSLGTIHSALQALDRPGLHVTVYDGDTISAGNINRQKFCDSDIGENKAVSLVTKINRFYGTYWQAMPYHFNTECTPANIMISAVDDWETRRQIDQWYKMISYMYYNDRYKPYLWMDLGNGKDFGQGIIGGCFLDGKKTIKLPTVADRYPDEQGRPNEPSCSLAEALQHQDLFINQMMATTASEILYRFLKTGDLETVAFFLNLKSFKINLVSYEQQSNAFISRSTAAA